MAKREVPLETESSKVIKVQLIDTFMVLEHQAPGTYKEEKAALFQRTQIYFHPQKLVQKPF